MLRTVSHSEHVRPLLSPGDIRELPVDDQLIFVTGFKPMRVKKARYYSDPTFMKRLLAAPDQSAYLNVPAKPKIDWLHERAKGTQIDVARNRQQRPLIRRPFTRGCLTMRLTGKFVAERPRSEGEYTHGSAVGPGDDLSGRRNVLQAAKERSANMQVSAVARRSPKPRKESLLSTYRRSETRKFSRRLSASLHALRRLDQRVGRGAQQVLKEMAGLGMQSFFNHTTADSGGDQGRGDPQRQAAFSSAFWTRWPRIFARANPSSTMFPLPEFDAPSESKTPQGEVSVTGKADPLAPVEKPDSTSR